MALYFFKLLKTARPRQWVKNLAIFAAIIFTGQLFNFKLLGLTFSAFLVFCALSSATYFINDVFDKERDKLHPFKKKRPIASGTISVPVAIFVALVLIIWGLNTAILITPAFFLVCASYIVLQFFYSSYLKHVEVLDILAISAGFILRVYAGEFATGFHINIWLLLCVISLSLFLAVGKRKSEMTLITEGGTKSISTATRATLGHYSDRLLDIYTAMFANASWVTYAFYTFLAPQVTTSFRYSEFLTDVLPFNREGKWLMVTVPLVIYGIMRYTQLVYEKHEGESPDRVLFADKPLLFSVLLWAGLVIFIIYAI